MKTDDEFNAARAQIRNRGNITLGLHLFRHGQEPALLYRLGGRFAQHPSYKRIVAPAPFPEKISYLEQQTYPSSGNFLREIAWAASVAKVYDRQIASFIERKKEAELAFLKGDAPGLDRILNEVEARFGQSLWLVENRMILLEHTSSAAARNRYVNSLRQHEDKSLFTYLISWYGYRVGGGVSVGEFERLIDEGLTDTTGVSRLLALLNGRYLELNQATAADSIAWSDAFPIVDRYHVLLLSLQCLCASGGLDDASEAFIARVLKDLYQTIPDIQLARLARAYGADVNVPLDAETLILLDRVRRIDEYGVNEELASVYESAETVEAQVIAAQAKLAFSALPDGVMPDAESTATSTNVLADLEATLRFADDGIEARGRLQKLILSSCNTSWAASLRLVLERQSHDERICEPTIVQSVLGFRAMLEQPSLILTLPNAAVREKVAKANLKAHPESRTVMVIDALCDTGRTEPLDTFSGEENAIFHIRQRRSDEAYELLDSIILESTGQLAQLEALRLMAGAYEANEEYSKLSDLVAALFVRSKYFGTVLPVKKLTNELLRWHDQPMKVSPTRGKLSVAIVFDIFSRYVSSQFDAQRADAFNDVLRAAGVRKASELDRLASTFPVSELIYFLRFVCVPDVLDQSLALTSSREVEDERVAILLLISELTAGRVPAAIKDELREIRLRQVVRDTTLRLDQSKIYVNVDGIRRAMDVSMRDDWNRYRLMAGGFEQTLRDILEQVRGDKGEQLFIIGDRSEKLILLSRMITTLRDEFTLNKEYGLNSNLSSNIRHGYVEREIRGPLLARNLITNKNSDSGTYLPNKAWLDRFGEEDTESRDTLSAIFDKFSRSIDDQIEIINRRLLRIHSEATPEGLFNYRLSEAAIAAGDKLWSKQETFDEFLDSVFATFWEGTQRNLGHVRAALTSTVLASLIECLTSFAQNVSAAGFDILLPDLEHSITMVQTEMRAAIERVSSWFTLSSNNEYQDFDLEIAFQAGMNTVKTYFRNLAISGTYKTNREIVMNGWCLPILARLLFLILDNAATHGAGNRSALKIALDVEVGDGLLFIKATNDLPPDHDNAELRRRVKDINDDYGQARAKELLSEEGGSGYPKIWKLLKTDLRKDHELSVIVTEKEFSVEIVLSTGGILNEAADRRG